uniref:BZIP domain-containing protein n=1 Tax=Megaselia scalaris TaxID=36166 RepID=T1H5Y4_MEGSC
NSANSILQKHIMQQYGHNELDELAAQEITLDLAHLIDDNFRESELGLFSDMVAATSPTTLSNTLQTNGVVAAAKVLQMQQQNTQQQWEYNLLAYTPQAVHSNATYTSNNSSDDNSSLASESSTIKEEPIDPQEYRRQFQEVTNNNFMSNNNVNGIYGLNAYGTNGCNNGFNGRTPHQNLPHLTGTHLAQLKHHRRYCPKSQAKQKSLDKTDEYRRRRERNNIAVRKSREKAKVRSREVEEKVKTLIKEKEQLLRRLEEMNNEMQVHQQIYLQLMNHANPEITRICGT